MALTGRFNLRKSFSGRIILQVEEEVKSAWGLFSRTPKLRRRWRDATSMDLPATELRSLMDLRNRPRFIAQAFEPTQVIRPTQALAEPSLAGAGMSEDVRSTATH
ncbi:hypothetical protein MHY87_14725 [Microvirga sp. ACRRW]|uniref:hypothetical protein n=1 Tax=Microvirga sp. ACRRW TaxID=2918205 RepID=UPI001EF6AF74|nr:hypothetical protein [Microvirga sp. ACRRW]MCG7394160.1 hypothetical protein [Microvirga sp. ACRRW]